MAAPCAKWVRRSIVTSAVLCTISAIFALILALPKGKPHNYFTQSDEIRYFRLLLTPFAHAFLWVAAYILTFLWLGYGVSTLIRRNHNGVRIYRITLPVPVKVYACASIAGISAATWWYSLSRQYYWQGALVSCINLVVSMVAMVTAPRTLARHQRELVTAGSASEVGAIIAFVHNGVGFWAVWIFYVTVLNICLVLVYTWGVTMTTATWICLALVWAGLMLTCVLDNCVWWEERKYAISELCVSIIALSSMLSSNIREPDGITWCVGILLFLTVSALFWKIARIVRRSRKKRKQKRTPGVATATGTGNGIGLKGAGDVKVISDFRASNYTSNHNNELMSTVGVDRDVTGSKLKGCDFLFARAGQEPLDREPAGYRKFTHAAE